MMTGDAQATDPVCSKSPRHAELSADLERIAHIAAGRTEARPLVFRNSRNSRALSTPVKS
jgi:PqqA peptide cyclase